MSTATLSTLPSNVEHFNREEPEEARPRVDRLYASLLVVVGLILLASLGVVATRDWPRHLETWRWMQTTRLIRMELVTVTKELPAAREGIVMRLGDQAASGAEPGEASYRLYRLEDWDGQKQRVMNLFFAAEDDWLTRNLRRVGALRPPAPGDAGWYRYEPGNPEHGQLVTWPRWEWVAVAGPVGLAFVWLLGGSVSVAAGVRALTAAERS